jgi:hypothetical protein
MNTATEFMIEAQEQQGEAMQTIFEELTHKPELIFNPKTLTHDQREEIIQAIYREDIYRIVTPEGKWKVWRRIFD